MLLQADSYRLLSVITPARLTLTRVPSPEHKYILVTLERIWLALECDRIEVTTVAEQLFRLLSYKVMVALEQIGIDRLEYGFDRVAHWIYR